MTVKMTFSLPDECAAKIRAAVASGSAASASAYVAQAIQAQAEHDTWEQLMADMDRAYGRPTPADAAWVESEFARVDKEWNDIRRSDD